MKTKKHFGSIKGLFLAVALAGLFAPGTSRGQLIWVTNHGAITITGYTGSGGLVTIPPTINGWSVVNIGTNAFQASDITGVTIPNTVTNIDPFAFAYNFFSLTSVTIPASVIRIGTNAFRSCESLQTTIPNGVVTIEDEAFDDTALTSVVIPGSVTHLGAGPFRACYHLTNITVDPLNPCYTSDASGAVFDKAMATLIQYPAGRYGNYVMPRSVTGLASEAFADCAAFGIYFQGNAPNTGDSLLTFSYDLGTNYYLPGTLGWSNTLAGRPTAPWFLPQPVILGVQQNPYGFTISWATNASVMVECTTDLTQNVWQPVQTNAMVNGTNGFSNPNWLSSPVGFYRVVPW